MATRWIPVALFVAAEVLVGGVAGAADPSPEALLGQGRKAQGLTEYDEAARSFEAFARLDPKSSEAPEALTDAVVLRLGLGQIDQAIADADLFAKNYGAKQPAQTAEVALALAETLMEKEDFDAGLKRIEAWIKAFDDKGAPLGLRVRAHAAHGRALMKQRVPDPKKAKAAYTRARDLWKDAPAELLRMGGEGENRRLARAITAAGEALFFLADERRAALEAIRMPTYKGPGDKADILRFLSQQVAPWVQKKRTAIEEGEKEYQKVLNLQPVPPPEWVIASAARVGQMWGKFVAEFRAAPIPREWKGHGLVPGQTMTYEQLRATYYQTMDDASAPQKLRAKQAFRACLDYAVKFQHTSPYSHSCEMWLAKNYPTEFPLIEELRPKPSPTFTWTPQTPLASPVAPRIE